MMRLLWCLVMTFAFFFGLTVALINWPADKPTARPGVYQSPNQVMATAAVSSSYSLEPKQPQEPDEDAEYTKVEIRGTLLQQTKEYLIKSQDRTWKLELGKDKVVLFLVQNLIGQQVTISGILHVDGKLDTVRVLRVEPVTVPPMGKD